MNPLQWFEFLASYAIQVGLVIAIAAMLDHWCVAASVKARVWNACFISILVLVVVGLLLPRLHLVHPWSSLKPRSLLVVAQFESVLGTSLLAIWVLGSAVMLARWAMRFLLMRRFVGRCQCLTDQQVQVLQRCLPPERLSVAGRPIQFRICPEEFGPFCYQLHQPFVFLPGSLVKDDHEILGHVLHHELTHLQTQHPLQLFCQRLVQCLLWFHPLVWVSSRRAALVREFVCDDASVQHARSATAYLKSLVSVTEETLRRHEGTLAIGRSKGELLLRVQRLTRSSPTTGNMNENRVICVMAVTVLLCSQVWLPTNPLASKRATWSPWPTWSAEALHTVNFAVRDYEPFEHGLQIHELIEASMAPERQPASRP